MPHCRDSFVYTLTETELTAVPCATRACLPPEELYYGRHRRTHWQHTRMAGQSLCTPPGPEVTPPSPSSPPPCSAHMPPLDTPGPGCFRYVFYFSPNPAQPLPLGHQGCNVWARECQLPATGLAQSQWATQGTPFWHPFLLHMPALGTPVAGGLALCVFPCPSPTPASRASVLHCRGKGVAATGLAHSQWA